jgi:nucleoside diphosphate kinase
MLTASKKKGHDYYYCTNGKSICAEHTKYMRSEYLDTLVVDSLKKLHIDRELLELAHEAAKEESQIGLEYVARSKEKLVYELNSSRQKQSKLFGQLPCRTRS